MIHLIVKPSVIIPLIALLTLSPPVSAEEKEEKDTLEEEISELEDADYPDLVPVDEESELMDEFALLQEEEIIFSAAKHQQEISESPSTITVITREQIENTHCIDVTCLLRQVPEIEVRRVMPGYHSVGARALASEQGDKVMLLIDGREDSTDAFGTTFWMNQPLHLEDIKRIEVVRGPGSALYGANAHSVVVSVTTRDIDSSSAAAFLGAGEHGRESLHLRVDQLLGDWRLRVFGGLDYADHWRLQDLSEFDIYRTGLRLERKWPEAVSRLDLSFLKMDGNIFTLLAPAFMRDTYSGSAMASHHSELIRAHIWFSLLSTDAGFNLPLNFGDLELGRVPDSIPIFFTTLDADVQINWSPFKDNLLIAGASYRWLSLDMEDNDPQVVHQHRLGFLVQDEHQLFNQLTITGGVRFDYNSITPETFSPRLAAVWRFIPTQVVRLAFGRAFRKPSFFNTSLHLTTVEGTSAFPDLKDFFQRSIGNDELGNESLTSIEAGYRGRFLDGTLTVEADVFFNLYRDTIAFVFDMEFNNMGVPDLGRSVFQFTNEGLDVNSVGGSISLTYRVREVMRLNLNYTGRFSYYLSESGSGLRKKGDRVPWEPAHLLNASATFFAGSGLRFGGAVHARSEFEEPWTSDGGLFSEQIMVKNQANMLVSAFVAWRVELGPQWFEAGVRAFNLLNTGFRDLTSITRFDGVQLGGQLLSRRIFVYLRASL
jgi:hypothetical protein